MKFKTLTTINSFLAFICGVVFALVPAQILASYDVSLTPMGIVIYQFWGAALIGIGLLCWFVRDIPGLARQKKLAMALVITNLLSSGIAIRGQYAGASASGWSTVFLFLALAVGFGIFLFANLNSRNKKESQ